MDFTPSQDPPGGEDPALFRVCSSNMGKIGYQEIIKFLTINYIILY